MIPAEDNCVEAFEALRLEKKARYIIYKVEGEKLVVENIGPKEHDWNQMVALLPEAQFRFIVFDMEYTNTDNMNRQVLIFVNWSPEETPLKKRMVYSQARQPFKELIKLTTKDYTIRSKNDLTKDDIAKILN